MRDVVMLLLVFAFFAVCAAYVWWCDRIIGPDPEGAAADADEASRTALVEEVTA